MHQGSMPVIVPADSEAADIASMRQMPDDGYTNYVDNDLFFTDHHDVLRAVYGEYPVATTPRQIDLLIAHLNAVRARMVAAGL